MTAREKHDAVVEHVASNAMAHTIDRDAVLREVGLNVNEPAAQAVLLICQRYGLDPVLKHVVLIQKRPYISRDGYLHIAHESGQLDGIEIVEEGDDESHWWARCAVSRKDMSKPFTYKGRYPKNGGNKAYGPEMAIKCAEVMALRRAFNVTGAGAVEERWDDEQKPAMSDGWPSLAAQRHAWNDLIERTADLGEEADDVKAWIKAEGVVFGSFTAAVADEWESRLESLETLDAELVESSAGSSPPTPGDEPAVLPLGDDT